MKRRIKLISSIFSLTLAMVIMSVGVYAAGVKRTASVTGTITFTATNLAATIVVNHSLTGGGTAGTRNPANGTITYALGDVNQGDKSVVLGDTTFIEATTAYTVTVVITNGFASGGRSITITPPKTDATAGSLNPSTGTGKLPAGVTVGIAATGDLSNNTLAATKIGTYTITYSFASASAADFSLFSLEGINFVLEASE